MKLLPPPGPERTRLIVLILVLGVAAAGLYYKLYGSDTVAPALTAPASSRASNASGLIAQATAPAKSPVASATQAMAPEPLRLPDLEKVPDAPVPGRNPFRFGVKALPPPPTPVFTPPSTPTPLPPPPPPTVPLRLTGVVVLEPLAKNRAFLADQAGSLFEAVDGQIVDGRYRVVAVGKNTAVVEFLDGSGRRTLQVGGRIGG